MASLLAHAEIQAATTAQTQAERTRDPPADEHGHPVHRRRAWAVSARASGCPLFCIPFWCPGGGIEPSTRGFSVPLSPSRRVSLSLGKSVKHPSRPVKAGTPKHGHARSPSHGATAGPAGVPTAANVCRKLPWPPLDGAGRPADHRGEGALCYRARFALRPSSFSRAAAAARHRTLTEPTRSRSSTSS